MTTEKSDYYQWVKDRRVARLATWLRSVNPDDLADVFHSDLAAIQIRDMEAAGLVVQERENPGGTG